jgi:hypothetical protein
VEKINHLHEDEPDHAERYGLSADALALGSQVVTKTTWACECDLYLGSLDQRRLMSEGAPIAIAGALDLSFSLSSLQCLWTDRCGFLRCLWTPRGDRQPLGHVRNMSRWAPYSYREPNHLEENIWLVPDAPQNRQDWYVVWVSFRPLLDLPQIEGLREGLLNRRPTPCPPCRVASFPCFKRSGSRQTR